MIKLELKNHQVWHDISEILDQIDVYALVKQHLEECDYKIYGYWDENDEFYEEIILPRSFSTNLVGSSIGITDGQRWIELNFLLRANQTDSQNQRIHSLDNKIGNLHLIYDDNLQFIDENWQININSPVVIAIGEQEIK